MTCFANSEITILLFLQEKARKKQKKLHICNKIIISNVL